MTSFIHDISKIQNGRKNMYQLMSTIFSEPLSYQTVQVLYTLLSIYLAERSGLNGNNFLNEKCRELNGWLDQNRADDESGLLDSELARQYTKIFFIDKQLFQDNASAALSRQHLIKREQWSQCKRIYYDAGFSFVKDYGMLEDSFAVQCGFMQFHISKTIEESDDGKLADSLREELNFLENHIMTWAEVMCERLEKAAVRGSIYHIIARCPLFFLNSDIALLNYLIES